ncbi:MAG: C25 family cysteine peptidase [Fibrobacterota bacterium]
MKQYRGATGLFPIFIVLVLAVFSASADFTILEQRPGYCRIRVTFGDVQTHRRDSAWAYAVEGAPAIVRTREGGQLPAEILSLALPHDRSLSVSLQNAEYARAPQKGPLYQSVGGIFLPENSAVATVKRTSAGVPVQSVVIAPLQYTDGGVSARYLRSVVAEIRYSPYTGPVERRDSDILRTIAQSVINPDALPAGKEFRPAPSVRKKRSYITPADQVMHFTIEPEDIISGETDLKSVNGVYRLTPDDLAPLGTGLSFSEISIQASNRDVFNSVTPLDNAIPAGLVDVPVLIRDFDNDGLFNNTDEILFYGSTTHYWYYDSTAQEWQMEYDDFDYRRHFWISRNGRSPMKTADLPAPSGDTAESGLVLSRTKKNIAQETSGAFEQMVSRNWKWFTMNGDNDYFAFDLETNLFSIDSARDLAVRFGTPNQSNPRVDISVGGTNYSSSNFSGSQTRWYSTDNIGAADSLRLGFGSGGFTDISYIDYRYHRRLAMSGALGGLTFYSGPSGASGEVQTYGISNLPAEYTVLLRINERENRVALIDTLSGGGDLFFSDSLGRGYQYTAVAQSAFISPDPELYTVPVASGDHVIRDIHGHRGRYDNIIVAPAHFTEKANELAQLKRDRAGIVSAVIPVEDFYREFAGGARNPAAVRNGMKYKYDDLGAPSYLTLLGDGHYDYKGYRSKDSNYIFPVINRTNICVEDFYAYYDGGEDFDISYTGRNSVDIFVGRIPAQSNSEIESYIDKLRTSYEQDSTAWRNRVLLMNDDDTQGGTAETLKHWQSSDRVQRVIELARPAVEISELNLLEYPFSGGGWTKPDARKRFFSEIEDGLMHINYFGHGSYEQVTDESIFLYSDIKNFDNPGRYFIFSAFSCAVSYFDDYKTRDIGSMIVLEPNKGAIASIGSSREAYHSSNRDFGTKFFRNFYEETDDGFSSVGMALGYARYNSSNTSRYVLMGDPSYRPFSRRRNAGMSLFRSKTGEKADTIAVFDSISLDVELPADFAGRDDNRGVIYLQNPKRLDVERKDLESAPSDVMRTYDLPGDVVHKSRVFSFSGDSVQYSLRIPRSVSRDTVVLTRDTLINGSLTTVDDSTTAVFKGYFWNGSDTVAASLAKDFTVAGINYDEIDSTDTQGPAISVRVAPPTEKGEDVAEDISFSDAPGRITVDGFVQDTTYLANDTTVQNFISLQMLFFDTSGIDHYYEKSGEGLQVSIDGVLMPRSLNEDYNSLSDADTRGLVTLSIPRSSIPTAGEYTMTVSAGDILGNRTRKSYVLDVRSLEKEVYTIGEMYAFPSPVHMGETTRFWFNQPGSNVERAHLRIYTMSGQLVRSFDTVRSGMPWDLRDGAGNPLSPNVYLYRLFVERTGRPGNSFDENTETLKSPLRKLIIYPPR